MSTDTHNLHRKLNDILCKTEIPHWGNHPDKEPSIENLEQASETLDRFIELMEDAQIGIQCALVPAHEPLDWNSPRKMIAPGNKTSFKLSVNPASGFDLYIGFEDKNFQEHRLSIEETAMLLRSFAVLRMTGPID